MLTKKGLISKITKLIEKRRKCLIKQGELNPEREIEEITYEMNYPDIETFNGLINSYHERFNRWKLQEEDYYSNAEDMFDETKMKEIEKEIEYDVLYNLYYFLSDLNTTTYD